MLKNQNEIEESMHINVSQANLSDLLDWWKNHEEEFSYLSKVARNVLCMPATSASNEVLSPFSSVQQHAVKYC